MTQLALYTRSSYPTTTSSTSTHTAPLLPNANENQTRPPFASFHRLLATTACYLLLATCSCTHLALLSGRRRLSQVVRMRWGLVSAFVLELPRDFLMEIRADLGIFAASLESQGAHAAAHISIQHADTGRTVTFTCTRRKSKSQNELAVCGANEFTHSRIICDQSFP